MRKILAVIAFLSLLISAQAAYLRNVPTLLLQPNGDTLRCFATGDEHYHRLHDAAGYTIVLNPASGYYVYAQAGPDGSPQPSTLVATSAPLSHAQAQSLGLRPGLRISPEAYRQRRKAMEVPLHLQPQRASAKDVEMNHGTINNIVVFVRFADEEGIDGSFADIDAMFNDSSANSVSQYQYFREASYGKLSIVSHFYPAPNGNTILSYQDTFARSHFMPYDATTNPDGYVNRYDGRERDMIERCVAWIENNHLVPDSLMIDYDYDGMVDNIVFVLSGTYTGWSDILWPHKWSLYDRYSSINGKRVYTFNLQLAGSGSHYFSSSTLCHEMFHALGAPDLYRYYDESGVSTAGTWDLMHNNTTPPQHMSAWMKWRYGRWLDSIPTLDTPGTYTLHSLADPNLDATPNRVYAIPTWHPNQYWVLEYRDNEEHFETALPGSGLLIWRADTRFSGNASFDTTDYLDELYLMRPGGTDMVTGGDVWQAHFGAHVDRNDFSWHSDPMPWLNPAQPAPNRFGTPDNSIGIRDIQISPDRQTLTFTYYVPEPPAPPACSLLVAMGDTYGDGWGGSVLMFEDPDGTPFGSATLTGGHEGSTLVPIGDGDVVLRWQSNCPFDYECSFTIYDADSNVLYSMPHHGDLYSGVLHTLYGPCAPLEYHITVQKQDLGCLNFEEATVSGDGYYLAGTQVTLTATPGPGDEFVGWQDGNTSAERTITVTGSATYTASFSAHGAIGDTEGQTEVLREEYFDVLGRRLPSEPARGIYLIRTTTSQGTATRKMVKP